MRRDADLRARMDVKVFVDTVAVDLRLSMIRSLTGTSRASHLSL